MSNNVWSLWWWPHQPTHERNEIVLSWRCQCHQVQWHQPPKCTHCCTYHIWQIVPKKSNVALIYSIFLQCNNILQSLFFMRCRSALSKQKASCSAAPADHSECAQFSYGHDCQHRCQQLEQHHLGGSVLGLWWSHSIKIHGMKNLAAFYTFISY